MSWLLRLYPKWWRERYADEFEALLHQRSLGLLDLLDIARCTLDAWTAQHNRPQDPLGDHEHPGSRQDGRSRRRVQGTVGSLAVAALIALGLSGLLTTRSTAPADQLYILSQIHSPHLVPIDPIRLTRATQHQDVALTTSSVRDNPFEVLQSADGRTVVPVWAMRGGGQPVPLTTGAAFTNPCDTVPRCREAARPFAADTGVSGRTVRLPVGVRLQGLSPDGAQLFGTQQNQHHTRTGWQLGTTFYAISTATGRVLHRASLPPSCASPTMYDAVHARVYALDPAQTSAIYTRTRSPFGEGAMVDERALPPVDDASARPGPPRLVACSLGSRHPAAQLVLRGVTYGSWEGRQWTASQSWTPAVALSPNGRQIAVYDGRSSALTVVDALHLNVLRSETVSRSPSSITRLAQWLGIAPTSAWAKALPAHGASLWMTYSPDGRFLYIAGDELTLAAGQPVARSTGIRAIDVASGKIIGHALPGQDVWWAQPAPDSTALYVCSLSGDATDSSPSIFRLDPRTLAVNARRAISLPNNNPEYFVLAGPAQ